MATDDVERFDVTENRNGLGFSNGVEASAGGYYVRHSDYVALLARVETADGRMCLNCGRVVPASHDRGQPGPDCLSPDACTFDLTKDEAWQHWRQKAHDLQDKLARLQRSRDRYREAWESEKRRSAESYGELTAMRSEGSWYKEADIDALQDRAEAAEAALATAREDALREAALALRALGNRAEAEILALIEKPEGER